MVPAGPDDVVKKSRDPPLILNYHAAWRRLSTQRANA